MAATTRQGERVRRPNLLLRRCRELQGWSQADVALHLVRLAYDAGGSMVQCSANVVGRWERGERRQGRRTSDSSVGFTDRPQSS
jgi:hypothetical protein